MSLPIVPPSIRRSWPWLRLVGGAAVLAVLLWHFGSGPFAEAWQVTTWPAVLAAVSITAGSTLTSAWRWHTIAEAHDVPLTRGGAVTAYYRSQFLNATLPGGILGDAHRALRHGRDAGNVPAGVRAAVWDRASGQIVQLGLVLLALVGLASPLRGLAPLAAGGLLVVGVVGRVVLRRGGRTSADLRALGAPGTLVRVVGASSVSSLGHLAVFVLAVQVVGVEASWTVLVTAGLVVMVGSSIPLSIAGWGPREGVTAWVFGVAGLGSATGLTVSVVYGVLAAVATLPGAVVLVAEAASRRSRARVGARVEVRETHRAGQLEGAGHV